MTGSDLSYPPWISLWMKNQSVRLWGAAELKKFPTPLDNAGQRYPFGISMAIAMDPLIMASIQQGPNQVYADEYVRVNTRIDALSADLAEELRKRGYQAHPLAASERTDMVNIKGDFPHKTAATRAGIGWIGRHCQLITREFGSWVRLATVFTDMVLPCGQPANRSYCGRCTKCVDACPADALTGNAWYPGLPREDILNVIACDQWKKENYFQYHNGHNCGICSAVCPYGLKVLRKKSALSGSQAIPPA
jgi:epoxyqueuosine reductase QueG